MTTSPSTHSCKGIYESICQVEFLRVPIRTDNLGIIFIPKPVSEQVTRSLYVLPHNKICHIY